MPPSVSEQGKDTCHPGLETRRRCRNPFCRYGYVHALILSTISVWR